MPPSDPSACCTQQAQLERSGRNSCKICSSRFYFVETQCLSCAKASSACMSCQHPWLSVMSLQEQCRNKGIRAAVSGAKHSGRIRKGDQLFAQAAADGFLSLSFQGQTQFFEAPRDFIELWFAHSTCWVALRNDSQIVTIKLLEVPGDAVRRKH